MFYSDGLRRDFKMDCEQSVQICLWVFMDPEPGGFPWRQKSFRIFPLSAKLMQHCLLWNRLYLQTPSSKQQPYGQPWFIPELVDKLHCYAVILSCTIMPCVHQIQPSFTSACLQFPLNSGGGEAWRSSSLSPASLGLASHKSRAPKSPDSHSRAVLSFTSASSVPIRQEIQCFCAGSCCLPFLFPTFLLSVPKLKWVSLCEQHNCPCPV